MGIDRDMGTAAEVDKGTERDMNTDMDMDADTGVDMHVRGYGADETTVRFQERLFQHEAILLLIISSII
jgi:hypothetical protein